MNKEDEKALKNLLKKVKHQTPGEAEPSHIETAEKELHALIKEHGIKPSSTLIGDLMDWKYD
jgi:hypothetical protein